MKIKLTVDELLEGDSKEEPRLMEFHYEKYQTINGTDYIKIVYTDKFGNEESMNVGRADFMRSIRQLLFENNEIVRKIKYTESKQ